MQQSALAIDQFSRRLDDFGRWRERLADAIQAYREWYDSQPDADTGGELRLYELIDSLRSDRVVVALVGEFSRGKTELINALFFADYNRRLLPSSPGRTTMCPTELSYDEKLDPCIRLLPIETRKSAFTVSEYRKRSINWTTLPLELDNPEQMAHTLEEIIRSKEVSRDEAAELGLLAHGDLSEEPPAFVEVPVWRHAIVNFPHRLLKQGLVIVDTPGLNALGAEPELTFNLLSRAHAVLFVLAADTGVTQTDLDVWKNHVCIATHHHAEARIAALNKIDTLWDDLHSELEVAAFINRQVEETRRLLNLDRGMVFPVSAQKGLVGKIRGDDALVTKSGLNKLETKLSVDIIEFKQKLVRDKVMSELGTLVESSRGVLAGKIEEVSRELNEIRSLRGKSAQVIQDMADKMYRHKELYDREMGNFQVTRRLLNSQAKAMLRKLNMTRFDELVLQTRDAMRHSWTTPGLRRGITTFFAGAASDLHDAEAQSDKIRQLVEEIYNRFHADHGLPKLKPTPFSVAEYTDRFDRLQAEAEEFRTSAAMLMSEQHYVIKKFFITLVSRARVIFQDCDTSARNWVKSVLTPIYTQIQEHKIMIDRRLDNLEKLKTNHSSLGERMAQVEAELADHKRRYTVIDGILENLD